MLQAIYLCLFACFGATATCFLQFMYAYWVKGEMRAVYLQRAGVGLVLAVLCYGAILLLH